MTGWQGHHVSRFTKLSSLLVLVTLLILHVFEAEASVRRETHPWRIQERTLEFSIEENCPVGTELGTVVLPLAPHYLGPPLKYRFGSPSKLFAVDETSGQLTTAAPIDAEALCSKARQQDSGAGAVTSEKQVTGRMLPRTAPESEFTDQVTCSQNGAVSVHLDVNAIMPDSSLRAVHRITVRVQDLNDNGPKFSQIRWHKRLKEVLYRKGRRLDLPKATDADLLDEYSRIQYKLEAYGNSTFQTGKLEIPFRLEVSSSSQPGLVLTEDLDAETNARHEFVLVAQSSAPVWNPSSSGKWSGSERGKAVNHMPVPTEARLHIDIEVADMNDNEPRFESPSYNVSIAEDTPPGTMIYKMVAHDPDSTAQLVYSMGSSSEVAVMSATFNVESSGIVRLRSFLNYELRHTYKLPIRVNDGEFTAQTNLFVHVLDVNDEPPEFEVNPKLLVADENASVGKLIGRVRIQDPDSDSVNGKVECWEPDELRRRQVLSFIPDPMTNPNSDVYDLTTRVILDREAFTETQMGRLFIYLICSDGNGVAKENSLVVKHTATMTATLTVRDANDHPPVFSKSVYHVTVRENNQLGEKIIQMKATDADEGENARISYSLLDRANFKVDSLTGWVTANVIFDRETRDSYQVTVIAMDHGNERLSSSVLLNMTVLDMNDHRPQLLPCDGDLSTVDHAHHPTGRVGDRNLFAVRENLPSNTYIGDVLATDGDIGLNAQLHFEFVHETPVQFSARFRLTHNGSLYTNKEFDREDKEYYRLAVRVMDLSPTDPLSSTGTISIVVLDVNDNAPTFVQPSGLLRVGFEKSGREEPGASNILHDQPQVQTDGKTSVPGLPGDLKPGVVVSVHEKPGYLITTLHAKDLDAGPNGYVRYTMTDVSAVPPQGGVRSKTNPLCHVKQDSGMVILQRHLTVSDLGLHFFKVAAVDDGYPSALRDTKILALLIKDIPTVGSEPTNVLASSYFSSNRTGFEFELWGFEGKSNLFIITVLASVSGLLASVLVTAIVCVTGPCSKNRQGLCGNRRRNSRGQRPVTSPGCSENGNGYILGSPGANGNGGGLAPYGLHSLNGDSFTNLPSRGVDPSFLLHDEFHSSCGRGGCVSYGGVANGNMTFPFGQPRSPAYREEPIAVQQILHSSTGLVRNFKPLHEVQSSTNNRRYENLQQVFCSNDSAHSDIEHKYGDALVDLRGMNQNVYRNMAGIPASPYRAENCPNAQANLSQDPELLDCSSVHTFCVTKPTVVSPWKQNDKQMTINTSLSRLPESEGSHNLNNTQSYREHQLGQIGTLSNPEDLKVPGDCQTISGSARPIDTAAYQKPAQLLASNSEELTSDSGHGGSEEGDPLQKIETRPWLNWIPIRIQCGQSDDPSAPLDQLKFVQDKGLHQTSGETYIQEGTHFGVWQEGPMYFIPELNQSAVPLDNKQQYQNQNNQVTPITLPRPILQEHLG